MICEKILGNAKDEKFFGKKVDYVDIQWDEAFKKLHRKTSSSGIEIGIRMDDSILTRGLKQEWLQYNQESLSPLLVHQLLKGEQLLAQEQVRLRRGAVIKFDNLKLINKWIGRQ